MRTNLKQGIEIEQMENVDHQTTEMENGVQHRVTVTNHQMNKST